MTIVANKPAGFSSDNANVTVDGSGNLFASADHLRPDGQATITATYGEQVRTCDVTIVNWTANQTSLQLEEYLPDYVLSKNGSDLYGALGVKLYHSDDDFATVDRLPDLPDTPADCPMLFTPHGVFLRTAGKIYKSTDGLQTWTESLSGLLTILYHGWDYYYDGVNVYIYTGEYDVITSNRHRIIRGTIASNGDETWDTLIEFFSRDEYDLDPINNIPSVEHIHSLFVDQSTGDVYASTGDLDYESNIYLSQDNGDTWRVLGTNSQEWRSLSIWFTTDYIYFNTDSYATQKIFRLARTDLAAQAVGNDLREEVITLDNGSQWYHCQAVDNLGRDVVIMSAAPEGQIRDWKGRVFMFYEAAGGAVETQEIFLVVGFDPTTYNPYTRIDPKFQNGDYIYFRTIGSILYKGLPQNGVWKMRIQ